MVFTVFLSFLFRLVFLPTTLALLPPGVMLLNRSTATRDSAIDIEETSWKDALERERPNRSVVKTSTNYKSFDSHVTWSTVLIVKTIVLTTRVSCCALHNKPIWLKTWALTLHVNNMTVLYVVKPTVSIKNENIDFTYQQHVFFQTLHIKNGFD